MKLATIDFETQRIESRPEYPPEPVSLAIIHPGGERSFMAWGHPEGNNCTREHAERVLGGLFRDESVELLFHHAKFDLAVAHERMGLPLPGWERIHDTSFLLYLVDPHSRKVDLKSSAEEYLAWIPEERDAVAEWVWENRADLVKKYGGKVTKAKSGPNSAGAWLSKVPAQIVEPYALGDTDRTLELFHFIAPVVKQNGMWPAYDRERRVLKVFMDNEQRGMPVDIASLKSDLKDYRQAFFDVEDWMRERLEVEDLNFDADADLAAALSSSGMVDDDKWTLTKTGRLSVSKENLKPGMFNDTLFASALGYRNRLQTALKMFMIPWYEQGSKRNGVISTNWNQLYGPGGGTRTGRPSTSNPNFLNISKSFEGKGDGYEHPAKLGLPELPLVRNYIHPWPDHLFLHRDYAGQEMRIFAHFESGDLMEAYLKDHNLDPHKWVSDEIERALGREEMTRGQAKIMNFQSLYGGGINAIKSKLECTEAEAKEYRAFHNKALPGKRIVGEEINRVLNMGEAVTTWGGRKYVAEQPKMVGGRLRDFKYKIINYIIQGSAADCTKEALANWYEDGARDAHFMVTVYDEINISAHKDVAREQMALLKHHMENVDLDVPMLSDGKVGTSWGNAVKEELWEW